MFHVWGWMVIVPLKQDMGYVVSHLGGSIKVLGEVGGSQFMVLFGESS